ncbi:MAG: hypothetical protein LBT09_09240 [Planctomycetaceae bacterium]|nr:hypothetical protein [Planctomycetaceae bacterium]
MKIIKNNKIIDNIDLDDIVQKILADLDVKPEAIEIRHVDTQSVDKANNEVAKVDNVDKVDKVNRLDAIGKTDIVSEIGEGELLFDGGCVISLDDVRRKLEKIQTDKIASVVIPSGCILTPSAKDELKKRKLGIIVRKIAVNNFPLCLVLHGNVAASTSLLKQLQSEYNLIKTQFTELAGIVDEALKIAARQQRGIILTQHPASVLRATGLCEVLRVIIAVEPKQVSIDAKEIDANLMIIPPARINESNILESVRNFCRIKTDVKNVI